MDQGHYNCRDYYISPPPPSFSTSSSSSSPPRPLYSRHESFYELELRSRSPASSSPRFPLLQLPLELRQQIFSYLLPRTLQRPASSRRGPIVWLRGNTRLLCVSRQVHCECAALLYGRNEFQLQLSFAGVAFVCAWQLASGCRPSRRLDFVTVLPARYRARVRRVVLDVELADDYTAMTKFNVGAGGQAHGVRVQVERLVGALGARVGEGEGGLARLTVRVSKGGVAGKDAGVRKRSAEEVEQLLEPLGALRGVREAVVQGFVSDAFARRLEERMRAEKETIDSPRSDPSLEPASMPQLCVYGNDL